MRNMMVGFLAVILSACGGNVQPDDGPSAETRTATASDSRVAIMGRTDTLNAGGVRFGYPGVSFNFDFQGDSLSLTAQSSSNNSYLDVIIDGEVSTINLSQSSSTYQLFNASEIAQHSVEIVHRSETWHGIVTLSEFEIGHGDLLVKPAQPQRKMIMIGDSVTCGEAIDRPNSSSSCGDKVSSWWNPRLSYGMLMAEELNAQVQLVCMGGKGLIRSWNGNVDEEQAPEFYDLAVVNGGGSATWNQSDFQADLVFVSLGTNDFSSSAGTMPTEQQYVPPYVNFVQGILNDHPSAQVVLTEGALLGGQEKSTLVNYLNTTKSQVGSNRVHVLGSNAYTGDDCDFHPTKSHHAQMTNDFVPQLKQIMNW